MSWDKPMQSQKKTEISMIQWLLRSQRRSKKTGLKMKIRWMRLCGNCKKQHSKLKKMKNSSVNKSLILRLNYMNNQLNSSKNKPSMTIFKTKSHKMKNLCRNWLKRKTRFLKLIQWTKKNAWNSWSKRKRCLN